MSGFDSLIHLAGKWKGTNRLWLSPSETAHESPTVAVIMPVIQGRFVRLDYAWAFEDKPQEGSLLLGREIRDNSVTAVWVDSWHMGDKVMVCRGIIDADGRIDVRGSYTVPTGSDWGWRTVIEPGPDAFRLIMYNVSPDGMEELAVSASYSREK